MHYHWLQRVLGFWNSVIKQPDALACHVLCDEVRAFASGDVSGWAGKLFRVLGALGFNVWAGAPLCVAPGSLNESLCQWRVSQCLPSADILTGFRKRLSESWSHARLQNDPRVCPSDEKQPGV